MNDPKHTVFAQQAVTLADTFQAVFGLKPIGKAIRYRAELSAPDGPSTGGGKQALQAIKLVPVDTGTTLVIGNANQVEGTAELRTYEYLTRWQQQRFKGAGELVLERDAYEELFQKLKSFLAAQRLRVNVVAAPATATSDVPLTPAMKSNTMMIAIGVAVGVIILGVLIYWLRH